MTGDYSSEVKTYYDTNQRIYDLFWSKEALHFGLWDSDVRSLKQAITRTNELVAKELCLTEDDVVLDAGCGVGGSSIHIASNYGCTVHGITISKEQMKRAVYYAKRQNLSSTHFSLQDFTSTSFDDGFFTKIFAIESSCHAEDKRKFLKEMKRLLTSHGTLVIVDVFYTKTQRSKREKNICKAVKDGWAIPNIADKTSFESMCKQEGFSIVKFSDKTKEIYPSSKQIFRRGFLLYPFTYLLTKLRFIPESIHKSTLALINQKRMLDANVGIYGMYVLQHSEE